MSTEGRIAVWEATDLVDEVAEYETRFGQTGSPTRVLAVKDVTPERRGEIAATPSDAAERILALLAEAGGSPASPWEKPERLGEKPGKSYDCWTVVELVDGRPRRLSLELLGKGRELALGMTGDCVDLAIDKAGRLIQYKPAYGGNIVSVIMGSTTPQLATVRPGMFAPVEPRDDAEAERVAFALDGLPEPRTRLLERSHRPDTAGYELDAASVVLCAGKGIGGPPAPPELQEQARRLGAAVAG